MNSTFDLVCVGSGAAGLAAALTAADAGVSVVVLEKGSQLGGTSAYSDGQIWIGANDLARDAGMSDSPADTREYLDYLSAGVADPGCATTSLRAPRRRSTSCAAATCRCR